MQKRLSIKKEIVFILIIKLFLLFAIWFFCFSHPPNKLTMPANTAKHIFNINYSDHKI
ncbi:MAG: cytochrome oxidase putative small subunit CydP [Gammaproteobacteria bacterium]